MKAILIGLMMLSPLVSEASSSKVICASQYDNAYDPLIQRLNQVIGEAKSEGYTKVSAPAPINHRGITRDLCVTVTKTKKKGITGFIPPKVEFH